MDQQIMMVLRRFISESSPEEVRDEFRQGGLALQFMALLQNPDNIQTILFEKNLKIFGGINEYVEDFLPQILEVLPSLSLAQQETTKTGARLTVSLMLSTPGLTAENRQRLQDALQGPLASHAAAPAAGRRRRRRATRKRRV